MKIDYFNDHEYKYSELLAELRTAYKHFYDEIQEETKEESEFILRTFKEMTVLIMLNMSKTAGDGVQFERNLDAKYLSNALFGNKEEQNVEYMVTIIESTIGFEKLLPNSDFYLRNIPKNLIKADQ